MQLKGKIFITGKLENLTGLSIGGSDSSAEIGGIDNNVIKTSEGIPYIPGSSLKGKMRSLLEIREGKTKVCSCGQCDICAIFGMGIGKKENKVGPTRLKVRDSNLDHKTRKEMEEKQGIFSELELTYTESKTENTIDRKSSKALNPRQTERVPAGSRFDMSIVFDILETEDQNRLESIFLALRLIEDDALGGSGSRGYGRISFPELRVTVKTIADYEEDRKERELYSGNLKELIISTLQDRLHKSLSESS